MSTLALDYVPVKKPAPDAAGFIDIIMGRARPLRTPLVEYIVDDIVMRPIVENLLGRRWTTYGASRDSRTACLDNFIAFWLAMGYDCVRFETGLPFVEHRLDAADPAPGSDKLRSWNDQHHGAVTTWEDFERYPWPQVKDFDFSDMEYINAHLPDGMGWMSCHAGGVFEHLSSIMSIEGLALAVCEQPDLVRAVADRVGDLLVAYHCRLAEFDRLVAHFQGDDMGFRTQTLIGPEQLREYCLPWHKRIAEVAHGAGRPYFLHSCGNLFAIMDALIEDVGIDAKHSYEDAIMPVEQFQEKYGGRIGVLGGLDINILAGGTPDEVRSRTRRLIETCGSRGRYAIGSGNSVPSYVPVENYLAMIDEANRQ